MTDAPVNGESPLAIVCCGGSIPFAVADTVQRRGRRVVLFACRGWADPKEVARFPHHWIAVAQLGRFRRLARQAGCRDVVFIGTLVRPSLTQLRLDWGTIQALPRIVRAYRGGDDHLLSGVAGIFEWMGFRVVGAQDVAPEILVRVGLLARREPTARDRSDIARGLSLLAATGPFDIGQAAVVADNRVLAIEAAEGTDQMLTRIAELRRNGRIRLHEGAGVLVKAPKPQQDQRIDLPAIGPSTIEGLARAGLAGLAVVAGAAVIAEPEKVIRLADAANVFVVGVDDEQTRPMTDPVTADQGAVDQSLASCALPISRTSRPLTIFLVAGEESGDRLGAALMRAMIQRTKGAVQFFGVGGHDMAECGMQSLFPIDDIAVMGFVAIPGRLPTILRRLRETVAAVIATQPDALVIIDSPDFTHRVARRVRAAAPTIPIVDYVSPSVWAWRPGRARAMRAYVDHILALLPFEPAAHARLGGPPCTYVGHPLAERAAGLRPSHDEARRRGERPPVVLVLPGSRKSEINRLLAVFGAAIGKVAEQCGPLELILPTVPHLLQRVTDGTTNWPLRPRIVVDPADKLAAFRIAHAALAASGTVTLELAIAGVPTVVAYKASVIEEVILRMLAKVPTIVLANLVLGENVMPELLQREANQDLLAVALTSLLADTAERNNQLRAFTRLDSIMGIGCVAPSETAAEIVASLASRGRRSQLALPVPARANAQA
jgi:lipid-A-disaccharide synthase